MGLSSLSTRFPWPEKKPNVPENMGAGWFCGQNGRMLKRAIEKKDPLTIVEVGSWLGFSTRFLCRESALDCMVIAIDHWEGSVEHKGMKELETLYETFIVNCWEFKHRILPVKASAEEGIPLLYKEGITPALFYLDAAHDAKSVYENLTMIMELFPKAHIVGDDWTWDTVREGVFNALKKHRDYNIRTDTTCYEVSNESDLFIS